MPIFVWMMLVFLWAMIVIVYVEAFICMGECL